MTDQPFHRPRRLRRSPAMRQLVAETTLAPRQLIQPFFVKEGIGKPEPVASMPGVDQHTISSLVDAAGRAADAGVGGVILFGVPQHKDARGSAADDPDGVMSRALAAVAGAVGDRLVVASDLCLDEYTDHGHCGILTEDGDVDNDLTLARYRDIAVAQAEAGSALISPSGMMDGQVAAIRDALDAAGRTDLAIMAYAVKYASAFYGPFRDAAESAPSFGDRAGYQMDPSNSREALRELRLDLDEGADIVMVKPALPYLDVLRTVAEASDVPVAAYQVSGEYSMVELLAASGGVDRRRAIVETLTSIRRAGADIILTYWATEVASWLR